MSRRLDAEVTVRNHLHARPDHTVSKQGIELYGQYYAPTKAEGTVT